MARPSHTQARRLIRPVPLRGPTGSALTGDFHLFSLFQLPFTFLVLGVNAPLHNGASSILYLEIRLWTSPFLLHV